MSFLINKKWIAFISIVIVVNGCVRNNKELKSSDEFYYVSNHKSIKGKYDTVKIKEFAMHSSNDSLFSVSKFVLDKREHELRRYSNIHKSYIDGTRFLYELDDFGVIYSSNLTFKNQRHLICSNDSINRIIDFALGEAVFNSEFDYAKLYENHRPLRVIIDK